MDHIRRFNLNIFPETIYSLIIILIAIIDQICTHDVINLWRDLGGARGGELPYTPSFKCLPPKR